MDNEELGMATEMEQELENVDMDMISDFELEEVSGGAKVRCKRYRIVWGDTLGKIAKRNGTSVNMLMRLNPGIKNANVIKAGWVIWVPV